MHYIIIDSNHLNASLKIIQIAITNDGKYHCSRQIWSTGSKEKCNEFLNLSIVIRI